MAKSEKNSKRSSSRARTKPEPAQKPKPPERGPAKAGFYSGDLPRRRDPRPKPSKKDSGTKAPS